MFRQDGILSRSSHWSIVEDLADDARNFQSLGVKLAVQDTGVRPESDTAVLRGIF